MMAPAAPEVSYTSPHRPRPYSLSTTLLIKAPLLFHHLLDLAETMESHGLAAHAVAPLALAELVARLCLGPPRPVRANQPPKKADDDATPKSVDPKEKGGQGKGASTKAKGKSTRHEKEEEQISAEASEDKGSHPDMFPALALACLRRSRLLLKLGPT